MAAMARMNTLNMAVKNLPAELNATAAQSRNSNDIFANNSLADCEVILWHEPSCSVFMIA